MQVRLFGEVEVVSTSPISLGGPNQRRMLAALAIRRGEVTSVPWLVDVIWPDGDAPARADHNVRTYVHRLRSALGSDGGRIETVGNGYRLRLDVDELDTARFESEADAASRSAAVGDNLQALDHARAAERLWLGRPLEAFEHEHWATPTIVRLCERRANLRELRGSVLVELGRPSDAVEVLESLVREEPLRERPRGLLMRALYESGRQAEALRAFQDFRGYLLDEIGVEPSADLVELDRSIAAGKLRSSDAPPAFRVGAYELHEPVGAGAFAIVHRATQPSLGREVAVKIIRAEFANDAAFIRQFETEAQTIARVEHTNIVPLYDYWREPDRAFLAMRWMSGGSLADRLGEEWSLDDALRVIDEIASALDAAHRQGVVHRDVKPENILFDGAGRAYLSDFGIAVDARRALLSEVCGSSRATLEQTRSEPTGPEADVLALAAMAATLIERSGVVQGEGDSASRDAAAAARATQPGDRYASALQFAEQLRAAVSRPMPAARAVPTDAANPFKGLSPFLESDVLDFHGRERLVAELVARLSDGHRMVALVGPSGSGKSSVVRAGLVPAIRSGAVDGSSRWFVSSMIPGDHPFEALETALLRVAVNPPTELLAQLNSGPRGLLRAVRRIIPDDDGVVLLVVDQFEELFSVGVSESDRDLFLSSLAAAMGEATSPLRIAITLRADFYDRPLRDAAFAPWIKQSTVAIAPLAPDELERAIVAPAARVGVGFEAGLVSEIVADVNRHPGALPLMQYALTNAFDHSDRSTITIDDYRSVGGLTGALAQRAEEIWQQATPTEQAATRRVFERLVSVDDDLAETRRRVLRTELAADPATDLVVERYGQARLLAFDHDPLTREPTLEVAHEAVLREWPRLRAWREDGRDTLRLHRHLSATAIDWHNSHKDPAELYRGSRLAAAEALLDTPKALNATEREFLDASLQERRELEAAQRRRARRRWYVTLALAVVAALAIGASVVAVRQRDRADDQAAEASRQAALALESQTLAEGQAAAADAARQDAEVERDRADQAAIEAEEGRQQAEDATAAGDLQRLEGQAVRMTEVDPTLAALLAVEATRISDGAVTSADAMQRVLSGTGGIESQFGGAYAATMLSDDGSILAGFDLRRLMVWDLTTREMLQSVELQEGGALLGSDMTSDGSLVAWGDLRGSHLLDVRTGDVVQFAGPQPSYAFASDGNELAVAAVGEVQFWDVSVPALPVLRETWPVAEDVEHVAWNPTDDGVALVLRNQAVQYWHRHATEPTWTSPEPILGRSGRIGLPATLFSTDGKLLVVANGEQQGPGAVVRTYATDDGEMTHIGDTPNSLNELIWVDEPAHVVAGTRLPPGMFAMDLDTGEPVAPPFEAPDATSVGYSQTLDQYVTSGLRGIQFRRSGSGPLERIINLPPEQLDSLEHGGSLYVTIRPDGTEAISAVFNVSLPTQTVAIDLTTLPPAMRDLGLQQLPFKEGPFTLMASPILGGNGKITLLDAQLEPVGTPAPTQECTRWWRPSPDGRFFGEYCEDFFTFEPFVNLYRNTGELVAKLDVPEANPPWEGINFSFTSDGSRVFTQIASGEMQWAVWDTETGKEIEHGTRDELQRPIVVDDTLYSQRAYDDFSLLQLDPYTYEEIGPPLEGPMYPLGDIAGDGRGELVAVAGFDGITRVFDTKSGAQLGRELTENWNINASFADDGTTLLVQSDDHISVWNYDRESWPEIACNLAGRNMTRDEWEQWGPKTIEYRATCPQFPLDA